MEAKDLRTESTLSERNNDGKHGPSGNSIHTKSKTYQDIGPSPSSKVDSSVARPCAVIGPDRVIPPPISDTYLKKASIEPWPLHNNGYRRPPEYPNKLLAEYQNQSRNISPRQTYQENMQRIMVPPTYNSVKVNEDFHQISDRGGTLPSKHNVKLNVNPDTKYCEVPYSISNTANDQKSTRNPEMCVTNVNQQYPQAAPQGWTPGCPSVRPRAYGAPDLYQYNEYSSCAGPRPMPIVRPHRTVQEGPGYAYPEPFYQDANIRFKPYPNVKEKYAQSRYEYIGNYPSPFYPATVPPQKYDIHKSMATHPYPTYPPLKGLESRMSEPIMEGYHRTVPHGNYNIPYRNPVIQPPYGSVIANCPQDKIPSYLSDSTPKIPASNKPPYDAHGNVYVEYENSRLKAYPTSENFYSNEMRVHSLTNPIVMPNYPSINMHMFPPHPYYKKDSLPIKSYEYVNNVKNMDPLLNVMNPVSRHLPHFSPGVIPISPTNSNASNETTHTLHDDCGYVSQSSGASVKSIDSAIYRSSEYYKRYYDPRYRPIVRTSPIISKQELRNGSLDSKDKTKINVRQFLQMWNEGDEETGESNTTKEAIAHPTSDTHNLSKSHDSANNHEQLYVLGLVNVPSEELSKYEHIQTVSKLPENIKGYNSIELLNQFEEVIESTNLNYYNTHENKMIIKPNLTRQTPVMMSRPLSPLDVEAKISQSVIHKEVGCNFEIKPCSPKMLNAEMATPIQNIFNERVIEKVTNPLSTVVIPKSMIELDNTIDTCNIIKNQNHTLLNNHIKTQSCKMANPKYSDSDASLKSNYSLHDLESNSGVCLASLPRLDNDIELNFPEVNQQFINANKSESIHKQSFENDLPQSTITNRNQILESNSKEYIVQSFTSDSEKQVSKLSKYRKNKNNGIEVTDEGPQSKIIRTDSVIIKNPENIRNFDENIDKFHTFKSSSKDQLSPMNLVRSPCDIIELANNDSIQSYSETENINEDHYIDNKPSSEEKAIDFSNRNKESDFLEIHKELAVDVSLKTIVGSLSDHSENTSSSELCAIKKSVSTVKISDSQIEHLTVGEGQSDEITENTTTNFEVIASEQTTLHENTPTKTSEKYSAPENINILNGNVDQLVPIEIPDVLKSEQEVLGSMQNNSTEGVSEKYENNIIENNHGEDIVNNEFNKEYPSLNPALESLQNVLVCQLSNTNKDESGNICNTNEGVNQEVVSDNSDTMSLEQRLILEPEKIKPAFDTRVEKDNEINDNSNKVTVSLLSETETFSNLLDTNIENASVKSASIMEKIDEVAEVTNTLNINKTHVFERSTRNENELYNNTTIDNCSIDPINSNIENDQGRVSKIQQIHTERPNEPTTDIKENSCKIDVPLHSAPGISDPGIQSNQLQISNENQDGQEKHLNEIEMSENTNDVDKVTSQVEVKSSENENLQLTQINPIDNKNNSEDFKATKSRDIEDHLLETNTLFEQVQVKSIKINENTLPNSADALELVPETSKRYFLESDNYDSLLHSKCDNIVNDDREIFKKTQIVASHIEDQFDELDAHEKNVLLNETEGIMDGISQSTVVDTINQKICSTNKTDELNLQKLSNQTEINTTFKYLPNDNIDADSSQENIPQAVISHSCSLDIETLKQIESNQYIIPVKCKYNLKRNTFFKKHLYSPLIQKLIIHSEGKCNNYSSNLKTSHFFKEGFISEFSNSSFITTNKTEDQDSNSCNEEILRQKEGAECSRLVDYDSSDYSLSPCAPSNFKMCAKAEQCNSEKYLQEISDMGEIRIKNYQQTLETECENSREQDIIYKIKNDNSTSVAISAVNDHENIISKKVKIDEFQLSDISNSLILESTEPQENTKKLDENVTASSIFCQVTEVPQHSLKRSLSDSAIGRIREDLKDKSADNISHTWSFKRKKLNTSNSNIVTENLCNVINSNRRNSISAICNEDNISFCIVINNDCIITEEDNDRKLCYTELSESLFEVIPDNSTIDTDLIIEHIQTRDQDDVVECPNSYVMECDQDKSLEETWVDDVACVETVVSDDVAEDVTISAASPDYISDYEESDVFCFSVNEHTEKVKHIYGDQLCQSGAQLVETLYNTPQMDVNKRLSHTESQGTEDCESKQYDRESLERILSDSHSQERTPSSLNDNNSLYLPVSPLNKDNLISPQSCQGNDSPISDIERDQNDEIEIRIRETDQTTQDDTVHSCESSVDNVFSYTQRNEGNDRLTFSSPEVSSTTSEDKGSSILLKITNFKGSIVSQISEYSSEIINNKTSFTTNNDTFSSSDNKLHSKKPLITKAAQKYIPPLKETIRDLKVKISLPQDSLNKLKQMKLSREELKPTTHNLTIPNIPKKPKPKFEDVLKSIDEIQIKMHKEKSKKHKKTIPKVVIKKSVNGSHYASTKNRETFNPDLTGRKWQPWVFLEKDSFIDKMAIKKKTKAIFNHRKKAFVLAEKFYKYKSVNSATFVISQPTYSKPSSGQLKYTIRLKHSY